MKSTTDNQTHATQDQTTEQARAGRAPRRLSLHRETFRVLTNQELDRVVGARSGWSAPNVGDCD